MFWRFVVALSLCANVTFADQFTFVGRLDLPRFGANFGGLSGIEVSQDGQTAIVISDRGRFFQLDLERQDGMLALAHAQALPFSLRGRDTEGLATTTDNRIFVSLEGDFAGVVELPRRRLPDVPKPAGIGSNKVFEALAVDRAGTLYVMPETGPFWRSPFPVHRFQDGVWQHAFDLPRDGFFLPVGADFGPDGALYILERHFNLFGFRSRIRRVWPDAPNTVDILLTTRALRHGNLEGLTLWTDANGDMRALMVSDDNFRRFQRSELVEYRLQIE